MTGLSANSYGNGPPRFGGSRGGPPQGKKFGNPGERLRKKHWNMDELPKFEKNFYQEHPEVARRTPVSKHAMQLGVGFFSCLVHLEFLNVFVPIFYCSKRLNTTGEARRSP